ncbi:MAG: nucleotide-binding protein [Gemmatimonadota bacterium]|nr:nucleotide-binding protein [Gemmatimonadota bacterium]
MPTVIPDLDWYLDKSETQGISPRCPHATSDSCPRFYQSLSLLGNAGSNKISKEEDDRLLKKWEKTDLWPKTKEQATSIEGSNHLFSNYCPEVAFERFGYFASSLAKYADEIDMDNAHERLAKTGSTENDWRWHWTFIQPQHYAECPLYSVLSHRGVDTGMAPDDGQSAVNSSVELKTGRAFVVHGRDDKAKLEVRGFLAQLNIEPVILDEQPSGGQTVIEKFEEHTDVDFAVVLLTPDDTGKLAGSPDEPKPRARQNVIFEFGFFVGKLGRPRVFVLHKGKVDIMSDYHGVIYILMDDAGGWKLKLAMEIKKAGINVDMNLLGE